MNTEYELDTARAKTPAERLRVFADLLEAQGHGETIYALVSENFAIPLADDLLPKALNGYRYVTKRRPVLVIPALELFDGPMLEAPRVGSRYFVPRVDRKECYVEMRWAADDVDADCMNHGVCFTTAEAAARVGLHIRNTLAKAVKS